MMGDPVKVKMLETRNGSNDGVNVETHREGSVCDVSDDLGAVYLREGWATTEIGVADKPKRAEPLSSPKNASMPGPDERLEKIELKSKKPAKNRRK